MKVKELIAVLNRFDPDAEVLLAEDEDGTAYRRHFEIMEMAVSGNFFDPALLKVGIPKLTLPLAKQGYTEEDVVVGKPAVVFY